MLVWGMCPKEAFCGLGTVEAAAALSVLHFNNGAAAILKVLLDGMGCVRGHYTEEHLWAEDQLRVSKSQRKMSGAEK